MKNWKTTLAGILGGLATYGVNVLQSGNALDWKAVALGAVPVIIGILAKDSNVTGVGANAMTAKEQAQL